MKFERGPATFANPANHRSDQGKAACGIGAIHAPSANGSRIENRMDKVRFAGFAGFAGFARY